MLRGTREWLILLTLPLLCIKVADEDLCKLLPLVVVRDAYEASANDKGEGSLHENKDSQY